MVCDLSCISSFYIVCSSLIFFFFFNDTATTEIYTLSLHDALPISSCTSAVWLARRTSMSSWRRGRRRTNAWARAPPSWWRADRKSTRLNSSHLVISYAVFCLKKKKTSDRRNHIGQSQHTIDRHGLP